MRRATITPILSLVVTTLLAGRASAAPTLLTTPPTKEGDDAVFFVGGLDDGGRSMKATNLDVFADGQLWGPPSSTQTLKDWATVSAEARPTWRPPLSVGLVYLWVEGVPAGVLDGIHAFFQRIPPRTAVYPTVYGRMRQGRAQLTASDISRLDEVPYLEAYRPNLIEAVRLDLGDLAADSAPLKVLLVVTDGRDFADPKGDGPGDFAALGRDIRKAGATPLIVAFRPPEADAAQATSNLRDLHEAAGGALQLVDQAEDIENTIESLGQGLADLSRVRITAPWSWRALGSTHRLAVRISAGGAQLNAEVGTVSFNGGGVFGALLVILVAGVIVAGVVVLIPRMRRGAGSVESDPDVILVAAHDLIRRGASPERAVEQLTRSYPEAVGSLVNVDAESLQDPRFPYFRTRPGRLRLQEIRDILAKSSGQQTELAPALVRAVANAVETRMTAEAAADTLSALVPLNDWMAFANLDLERLAVALRTAAREHPALGTPRARGMAVSMQDALRSRGESEHGIVVGWLVRAGGPGRRGETLKVSDRRAVIGQAATCAIRLMEDPTVAAEHAEITMANGEFTVAPLGGKVRLEGAAVDRPHVLVDGETMEIGAGRLVFKSASVGNLIAASGQRAASPATARGKH
jgi:hypothetical protein